MGESRPSLYDDGQDGELKRVARPGTGFFQTTTGRGRALPLNELTVTNVGSALRYDACKKSGSNVIFFALLLQHESVSAL